MTWLARASRRAPLPGKRLRAGDRAIVSVVLGGWGAFIAYFAMVSHPQHLAKDLSYPWRAARAVLDGQNPYQVIQAVGAYPFNSELLYPLPAAIAVLPLAPLLPHIAGAVFLGLSSALLAWGLLRDSPQRLWLFASAPFVHAAILGQWAPLLTAAAFLPALQAFAAVKPTVGLAVFLYRPSWKGIAGGLALVAAAFAVLPTWPVEWLEAAASTGNKYRGPATTLAGCFLLLGLFRWRRREARLLVSLALMPQLPVFYDTLPLWLVPSTWQRSLFMTVCSWVAYVLWYPSHELVTQNQAAVPLTLAFIWAPALLLLLLLPAREDEVALSEPRAPGPEA